MAIKFTDIYERNDEKNPNTTLDIELNGEEISITLRNILRLTDEESEQVGEALAIMGLDEKNADEVLTEEEKSQNLHRVLADRISAALRATADNKEAWDAFVEGLRADGDFKTLMIELFTAYAQETKLGEAEPSEAS